MSYLNEVIQPGETLRRTGRLHWIIYARGVAFMLVFALFWILSSTDELPSLAVYAFWFGEFAGLCLVLDGLARQATTEIFVTDRRAIIKTGFIARRTFEMNMDKIESVDVSQSVMGRLLGYGTVVLRGTGMGIEKLGAIADPIALRKAVTT
jgi:uncharacterized membrane protein YdbT with pleckstrin-like domain